MALSGQILRWLQRTHFTKFILKNVRSWKEVKLIIRVLLGTKSILFFVASESSIASYIISPKIAKYCQQTFLHIIPALATFVKLVIVGFLIGYV